MSESPFFQFYPSDWLAGTRGLTAAETGVYITLVAMMYEAEGPIADDRKRLARLCGSTLAAFNKVIDGLLSTGKLTLGENGFSNRRVEIEIEKRTEKRASASASANARWKKTEQNQRDENANASNPQCERNANQKPEPDITEANASDADASPDEPDFRDEIWTRGVAYLQRKGIAERNARTVIGKWIKDHGDAAVFSAFEAASRERPVEPVAWITARLGAPPKQAVDMDAIWKSLETGATQ